MSDDHKIVSLTINPSIDINTSVHQVQPENKLRCEKPSYEPGGGGLNVSRAIKKLGGQSLALFASGGSNGSMLKKLLHEEGIRSEEIEIKNITRENFTVYEGSSELQYRFVMPGPELSESEWNRFLKFLSEKKQEIEFIVASGSLPQGVPEDFYAQVARVAAETDSKMILDTKGEALKKAVQAGLYMVKCNLREFEAVSGQKLEDDRQIISAGQDIVKQCGCRAVVITLGAGGAMLITSDSHKHYRSPTVPIRSKVGAGDSMTAGIVLSLSRGKDLDYAIKYGIAAGAAAVMTPGTELCSRDDTERLLGEISEE